MFCSCASEILLVKVWFVIDVFVALAVRKSSIPGADIKMIRIPILKDSAKKLKRVPKVPYVTV